MILTNIEFEIQGKRIKFCVCTVIESDKISLGAYNLLLTYI